MTTVQNDNRTKAAQTQKILRELNTGLNQDLSEMSHLLEHEMKNQFKHLEAADREAANPEALLEKQFSGLS